MTRKSFAIRHLKAVPPDADTARKYFLHWQAGDLYANPQAFPRVTSEELFGNSMPLELEIGCGTGEFLCSLAAGEPARDFVGFDISLKSLYIAVEKARKLSLDNIKFIKAPFQMAYPLLAPDSLTAAYMHFPDPCIRPKYRKRKLFNQGLLDQLQFSLVDGGLFSVMTDVPELFKDLLALIEQDARFEKVHEERYLTGFTPDVKSRYQSIWEKHGMYPLRLEVRKKAVTSCE